MNKKHIRWIYLIILILFLGLVASTCSKIYQYQKRNAAQSVSKLALAFSDAPDWIRTSDFAVDTFRKYIAHLAKNAEEPWPVTRFREQAKRPDYVVVAIGDSLTAGRLLDEKQGWVYFIERLIAYEMPGKTVRVINAGVPGNTILQVANRLHRDLLTLQPDLVIIGLGFNDSRIISSDGKGHFESILPLEQFENIYGQVLAAIQDNLMCKVIVFSPAPVGSMFQSDLGPRFTQPQIEVFTPYAKAAELLAAKYHVSFADVYKDILEHPLYNKFYLKDELHPNPVGNLVISKSIFTTWTDMQGIALDEPFLMLVPKAIGKIQLTKSNVKFHGNFNQK